jgi:purine catabolism regulator
MCLALPEFAQAQILVGGSTLVAPVSWVSVIEWPVEHFVSPQDLVLTTGVGCDEEQLREIVRQVAAAGATAVCISTGRGAIHKELSAAVVEEAERAQIALVALPWQVRFADLSRAIIQALYGSTAGADEVSPGLPVEFTHALLGPSGIVGVAEALEQVASAPVVILDAILATVGSGQRGTEWLSGAGVESALIESMVRLAQNAKSEAPAGVVATQLGSDGGSDILVAPALVHDGVLGWVIVSLVPGADGEVVERALLHASTATAIELLRKVADDEAESRAREAFVWEIAHGTVGSIQELTARSALLGLSLNSEFTVDLGLVEVQNSKSHGSSSIRAYVNQVRRRMTHPNSIVALSDQEILLCRHQQDAAELGALMDGRDAFGSLQVTWGSATGTHALPTLAQAVTQARTALSVARALWGPGASGRADQLGAFMLLHRLAGDEGVQGMVEATLGPLENADRAKKAQLISTLTVYLESNGNISSAARSLYLNRHSLIYRLRRITELTGLDLDSHDDRLLLSVSLKIRQLQDIKEASAVAS